ncbi:MAG: glutathione synthase [Halieaceae bacterium]|jgi:glutathione synthase|uniref:Glutathione synthetase n=1 Tax=Candidatus Seongchinamella marina TaxID=2518990 RepID=A0ABT3SUY6_9GAMM|nr:glutathione synthase [Candidatus Seongchinamella marina]MBT3410449.1 glutathione synthase [Halieaceae bacterium]MBT6125088.1 glutathione synthase [Halieaceae bacterium]MBT7718752.1 glutathione synthase [Halieaceae bacterium]MCX2973797.1 glutathione synthase [Candidatus Seongchinamella marina]
MTIKLGVVMDPIADINYKKDTTLAMLWAATARDWQLFYMEQKDLYLRDGEARASMSPLTVFQNPDNWYDLKAPQDCSLADLDVILMRKDPPFDNEYIYSTYILEDAERRGSLIVNRCQGLRDSNEKVFATQFPQCCPPVLVSRDMARLRQFHKEHNDVIFKPLDGMGGTAIFRAREDDPNVSVILETLTEYGQQSIMAQRYIPEIVDGDKRILVINGEAVPYCLARVPLAGELRGNLAAGGTGRAQPLTDRDRWIAEQVAPFLRERGILFAGLDVIGEYLTEINVTSPTCIREIDAGYDLDIAGDLMDCIVGELERRS